MLRLESERLMIVPLTLPLLEKLLIGTTELEKELKLSPSGLELDLHTQEAMRYLYRLAGETPDSYPWITNWQIIEKARNLSVGSACFMNVPNEKGEVEIGYGIHPQFQNRGYMTEALRTICEWGLRQDGVHVIRAESEPDNIASRRVLAKCGFVAEDERFFILPDKTTL